jgi:hypothetical protein
MVSLSRSPGRGLRILFAEQLYIGFGVIHVLALAEFATDFGSLHDAQRTLDVVIDVLNNPHARRPEGESMLGRFTKESALHFLFNSLDY